MPKKLSKNKKRITPKLTAKMLDEYLLDIFITRNKK